jgi:hypothetical protein
MWFGYLLYKSSKIDIKCHKNSKNKKEGLEREWAGGVEEAMKLCQISVSLEVLCNFNYITICT